MRKIFAIVILIITSFFRGYSTEQVADILIIGTDTIYLKSFPLEDLRDKQKIEKAPFYYGKSCCPSKGCWRGYIATWKIIKEKLMLIEVVKLDSTAEKLNIIDYLKDNNYTPKVIDGFVFADWYTDTLKQYYDYTHLKYFYIAKEWLKSNKKAELIFENGIVVKKFKSVKEYKIGDTLSLEVEYYWHWLLKNKKVTVKGTITDNNGSLVRLKIISFGTRKRRIIKKVKTAMRYKTDDYWTNPRYWKD